MRLRTSMGFTLIEITVVLLLLAGGAFLLITQYPGNGKQNLDAGAAQLLMDLREARQAAVSENAWYEVVFYPYENQYRINKGSSSGTTKVKDRSLPQGISFVNTGTLNSVLRFNANGTPSRGVTISLVNSAGTMRKVIVAPVEGRIREE